jgi:hypothetical protein
MNVRNVEHRFWRTDLNKGRNIYALVSNDPNTPSSADPLIGVMESSALTEDVVNVHNDLLEKYGRHYPEYLARDKANGS